MTSDSDEAKHPLTQMLIRLPIAIVHLDIDPVKYPLEKASDIAHGDS